MPNAIQLFLLSAMIGPIIVVVDSMPAKVALLCVQASIMAAGLILSRKG